MVVVIVLKKNTSLQKAMVFRTATSQKIWKNIRWRPLGPGDLMSLMDLRVRGVLESLKRMLDWFSCPGLEHLTGG